MRLHVRLHYKTLDRLRSLCRGETPAKVMIRAQCLLRLHEGLSVPEVAELVGTSEPTVKRVRKRYLENGLEDAIYDRPRPGRPRGIPPEEEKGIIALACSSPPQGAARWTIRLLSEFTGHSYRMVRQVLHEDGHKPWREKNVVRAKN